jgi:hypothetical protein
MVLEIPFAGVQGAHSLFLSPKKGGEEIGCHVDKYRFP